jgi:hypothetical protein
MKASRRSLLQDKSSLTETLVWSVLMFIAAPLLFFAFPQFLFWMLDPISAFAD